MNGDLFNIHNIISWNDRLSLKSLLPPCNHSEADEWGRGIVTLLAVDADVVAGVEEAATKGDTALIHHLRHIAAHIIQTVKVGMMRINMCGMLVSIQREFLFHQRIFDHYLLKFYNH